MATLIHQHQTGFQLNYSYYGNAAPALIDGQFDGHGQIMHWLRDQRAGGVIGVLEEAVNQSAFMTYNS